MADEQLEKELSLARRAAPVFGLGRQQQVIWGARRRLHAAPVNLRRVVSLLAAVGLVAAGAATYVWFDRRPDPVALPAVKDEHWALRDGSRILIETPDTKITKQRESDAEVVFELQSGAARFDVAHRPERTFRVQAGPVRIEVIGTRFRVERQDERALVSVERGRVRVSWNGGSEELSVGERGVYPPSQAVASASATATVAPGAGSAPANVSQAGAARASANEPSARAPSAEDLFATADRARAAGRPQEAARALRELTQKFPHDGRAPLAAFTLGRLLLENLGQPAEAARAFAQARALAGGSSALAEDALAREADAWRAAGHATEAAERAKLYRTLYPHGAHLKEALRVGEPPSP